jgi:hypothetical protein
MHWTAFWNQRCGYPEEGKDRDGKRVNESTLAFFLRRMIGGNDKRSSHLDGTEAELSWGL